MPFPLKENAVQFRESLVGGGILCKEASLAKRVGFFVFFRVRLSSERNLGCCTYLVCGAWGAFLPLSSISSLSLAPNLSK